MTKKTKGVIAAGQEKTAEAGRLIFEEGGNAFDAAIAATLAAFVVESTLTSAAGGGFCLAHTADKQNLLFDFFSQTPRNKKPLSEIDFYAVDLDFGGQLQSFHIGLGSMALPGNLAGVFEVHNKLGRLPLKIVAQPAIDYAQNGFVVNHFQDFCYQLLQPILLALPEGRKIYAPQGKLLTQGDICYMKDFAASLDILVERGVEEFYQGFFAHKLVNDCQELGGYITQEDLSNYRVITRKPLDTTYRGYTLLTNPPPSSGGALIAFALKLLEPIDLTKIQLGSAEHLELLAKVMKATNEARKDGYDKNIYQPDVADTFLADEHLQKYQINKWGSTTHISVMDEEGNAASITTSNGEGSSYIIPGTGIMLNNMLGEADLNPLGFHQWQCDQRISSMMSPTMILKEGKPQLVLGSGGSNRIRTAILQVISNLIDFNLPVKEAVELPRVHWENNVFSVEPPYNKTEIERLKLPELTEMVLWEKQNMFFGGVNGVSKKSDGGFEGAGDPRRGGVSISNSC